jgi:hypothetical protein
MFGAAPPLEARAEIAAALDLILDPVANGPRCLVHRDFFAGNLLWLPDRAGPRRAGIIDFQSAAIGHPAYDLVSLLQDARRDITIAREERAIAKYVEERAVAKDVEERAVAKYVEERAVARYLSARPEYDSGTFRAAYAACAAQRHLRVACQWVRLAQRDHRPQYLVHGPRTWALLTRALSEPSVAPLAAALDKFVPLARRHNPPGLTA